MDFKKNNKTTDISPDIGVEKFSVEQIIAIWQPRYIHESDLEILRGSFDKDELFSIEEWKENIFIKLEKEI